MQNIYQNNFVQGFLFCMSLIPHRPISSLILSIKILIDRIMVKNMIFSVFKIRSCKTVIFQRFRFLKKCACLNTGLTKSVDGMGPNTSSLIFIKDVDKIKTKLPSLSNSCRVTDCHIRRAIVSLKSN